MGFKESIYGAHLSKNPTDIDFCASGLHRTNKLHNSKCQCLIVIFNYCLMHDRQIPNFYLANLETGPSFTIFTDPQGLGIASYQKVTYDQMLMIDGHQQFLPYA